MTNAAAATDAESRFRAAMAMLADAGQPPDWQKVTGLIGSAADSGHAAAIERRALLECRGVGREPDWDRALDSLAVAAEHGSISAARQLILLAEDRYQPAAPIDPGPGNWARLRGGIATAWDLRS